MGRWRALRIIYASKATFNLNYNRNPPLRSLYFSLISENRNQFLNLRLFSALPFPSPYYTEDFDFKTHNFVQNQIGEKVSKNEDEVKIPVKAFFLCTSIDLKNLQAENSRYVIPATSRSSNSIALQYWGSPLQAEYGGESTNEMPRNYLVVNVKGFLPSRNCLLVDISLEITLVLGDNEPVIAYFFYLYQAFADNKGCSFEENVNRYRYMVIFQYGSAVLFNVEDHEVDFYLQIVRGHASGLLPEMRKDDYAIKEKPLLVEDMQGGPDYIVLKNLDLDSIRIIGSVLGQSIALDYFVSQVDGMVEEFAKINRGMEQTGTFTMHRKKLFQLVGKANSNLADVILKVGLFERSEIAWRDAKYAQILDYLREEYEVTQRFGNLDFKLKFVEHNIHFLQEVLQNRKSDLLEWCIIVLLGIENVISVYEIVRESVGTLI